MTETNKKNWISLVVTLIAGINAMLVSFGYYHLSNQGLQTADVVVSWVFNFIGVAISHRKSIKYYFTKGRK